MREYLPIAAVLLMILLMLPGCGPSEADANQAQAPRELSFVIVNKTGGQMRSIGLEGANYPMSFSPISNGETKSLKSKKLELPERLTLHWSDARGDRYESSVDVWGELSAGYSGPVTLTVTQRKKVVLTGG